MVEKTEILLTIEEIKEIQEKAFNSTNLRQPNLINLFGKSHKTIFNLSYENGLILIQGNEYTGFEHIRRRHEFYSRHSFWKEKTNTIKNELILDKPSKFSPRSTPILDYVKISDKLYKPENLNNSKNKNPELFDMYTGKITYHGNTLIYHLLIYKDSKIIHTLYPDKSVKKIKKLKGFHFSRGAISVSHDLFSHIINIKIPYFDGHNKRRYVISIEKNIPNKVETTTISKCDLSGNLSDLKVILIRKKFSYYKSMGFESVSYEFADLRELEKQMLDLENR
jgi:hypothetical protein